MKIYQNEDLKRYIDAATKPEWKERDFVNYVREYMNKSNLKVLAIGGLMGTGKTTGLLQAIKEFDACYIVAEKEESETSEEYIEFFKNTEKKYIVIDEYGWIKERSLLDKYLFTAIQNGKRIAITGKDNITLEYLNYGDLMHRVDMVHCTFVSYDEYCRINDLTVCKKTREDYLNYGGICSEWTVTDFDVLKNYIKVAIIDNMVVYTQIPVKKVTAIVYSILNSMVSTKHISDTDFFSESGDDIDITFTVNQYKRVKDILEEVGVIVTVPDCGRNIFLPYKNIVNTRKV